MLKNITEAIQDALDERKGIRLDGEMLFKLNEYLKELQGYRKMKNHKPYMMYENCLYEVEADVWAIIGEPLLKIDNE